MASSVSILNRMKLWISTSTLFRLLTLKSHGILRLALIPVWNEQNQPSFINQTLLKHKTFLPVVHFASKNTPNDGEESDKSIIKSPKSIKITPKINSSKKSSDGEPPKEPSADDLAIKEISGDLPKLASNKIDKKGSRKNEEDDEDEEENYIPLMNFPEVIWPGLWKLCKNLFMIHFVIHVKIDAHFDPKEFLTGSREAISQISTMLSEGKIDELKGYVTDDVIKEVKSNLKKMNLKQRHNIQMNAQDIYVGFIDLIEVIVDTDTTPNKTFVEITCCFHSLRDLISFKKMYPETTFYNVMDHKDRISIGNYRFIRDYTEGSSESGHWVINKLNHFRPLDLPDFI